MAKAFIIAGAPNQALEVIDRIPPNDMNHWILYRKAEAQLALGLPLALDTAQEALREASRDERAQKLISSYHDQLSQCLERSGDLPAALQQAQLALENSEDEKYRQALETRLEKLRQATA